MGSARSWTAEEDRLLREQYHKLSAAEIAAALGHGRTVSAVQMRANRLGVKSGRRSTRLTDAQVERAVELLRAGWTLRAAAVDAGRSPGDFSSQLKRVGVDPAALRAEVRAAKVAGVGSVKPAKRRKGAPSGPKFYQPAKDDSLAGRAADYLRRDYAPVYHRGRENKAEKGIWQVGHRRLTESEMIALAKDKGMDRPARIAPAPTIRSSILEAQARGDILPPPAGYDRYALPPVRTMYDVVGAAGR